MKKIMLFAMAIVALSFASCGQNPTEPVETVNDTVVVDTLLEDSIDTVETDSLKTVDDMDEVAE